MGRCRKMNFSQNLDMAFGLSEPKEKKRVQRICTLELMKIQTTDEQLLSSSVVSF